MTVEIRRAEPLDAKEIKKIYECRSVYTETLQLPLPSTDLWEKRFQNIPENVYIYVAVIKDEIVGNLGLEVCKNPRRCQVATFGMGIKENVQGQGVGYALLEKAIDLADNWLNLKRIELTVYIDNARAINLYKKFGFIIEGCSSAYAFRNGAYVDVYHMARVTNQR